MWLALLRQAVEASSQGAVAEEIGVSRTAISLVLNGKYPAKTYKIEQRVMMRYGRVHCPHLGFEITFASCHEYHDRDAPTSSPFAMRHWRACQTCTHNPMRRAS